MIPLQPASKDIWDKKYRLKRKDGRPIDETIDSTYQRIARTLANVEQQGAREKWFDKFLWALNHGVIPAGRIVSNAGAKRHKPSTSTINCTVSGTVHDSMDEILNKVHEAGMTLKAGCGIGYEFSTLRPNGAYVAGAGSSTSGPLSFMDIYDAMCRTVASAGGRRGAQMATFDVSHPDIFDFIRAKREDGRFRQFNLSCLITEPFMEAVQKDTDWPLCFPATQSESDDPSIETVDRPWPTTEGYQINSQGDVVCRVYRRVRARKLWDLIMSSTYDYAEPGFILIDKANEMNNLWFCENIRASNPCGEQPLPPYGACLLGSINLTCFIQQPFTSAAFFDWKTFREVVRIFTRMLDNVVNIHGLPLNQQTKEIQRKRRHGMGFMGLGSSITMMCMRYGDTDSIAFTEQVAKEIAIQGWTTGVELAKEKGPAPIMEELFKVTETLKTKKPDLPMSVGDEVSGKVLLSYSSYFRQFPEALIRDIREVGSRFTHHSSIAPTGTIALSLGNNVSNGIEPSFAHQYSRNIIREGKKTKEKVDVYSYELLAYRKHVESEPNRTCGKSTTPPTMKVEKRDFHGKNLPDYFMDAGEINPKAHVDIQAAAQKWIDSSISKTINVPTDYPFDDFKEIYLYAYQQGLKGCTTFRFNPEVFQGVLVKDEDLEKTTYRFTLEDGSSVELKGNEEVTYDGEIHTAANLFDALKEGYYDKN